MEFIRDLIIEEHFGLEKGEVLSLVLRVSYECSSKASHAISSHYSNRVFIVFQYCILTKILFESKDPILRC